MIENYDIYELRMFLLQNLQNTFEVCPSIPISIVVEPLVKHLQT